MNRDKVLLKRNIARLRRDIRLQARELQALVDADLDCSGAARMLMHMHNDLRLYLEKLEGLQPQWPEGHLPPHREGTAQAETAAP